MVAKRKKPRVRPEHFITTVPVIRPCARCGVWLAAGISEGMHVQAELTALDAEQTILAMLVKLRLFCLTRTGLVELDTYRLRDERFVSRLPEHRCGIPWESRLQAGGRVLTPAVETTPPY
jgi:hypothetical protein